jgi:valyl-tRNA synthetase
MVKPPYGEGMDQATYDASVIILENLLKVLHPFMPFLTEEIWHFVRDRQEGKGSICVAPWPILGQVNTSINNQFDDFAEVVIGVRNIRKEKNIPNKEKIKLMIKSSGTPDTSFDAVLSHLCNISSIEYTSDKPAGCFSFVTASSEYFIPFTANVDVAAEREKIEQELSYVRGFLNSVEQKLNNERFVSKAPQAVLDAERKKQSDSLAKIAMLEDQLKAL